MGRVPRCSWYRHSSQLAAPKLSSDFFPGIVAQCCASFPSQCLDHAKDEDGQTRPPKGLFARERLQLSDFQNGSDLRQGFL